MPQDKKPQKSPAPGRQPERGPVHAPTPGERPRPQHEEKFPKPGREHNPRHPSHGHDEN
jgi:hypothetical protein